VLRIDNILFLPHYAPAVIQSVILWVQRCRPTTVLLLFALTMMPMSHRSGYTAPALQNAFYHFQNNNFDTLVRTPSNNTISPIVNEQSLVGTPVIQLAESTARNFNSETMDALFTVPGQINYNHDACHMQRCSGVIPCFFRDARRTDSNWIVAGGGLTWVHTLGHLTHAMVFRRPCPALHGVIAS
jgi:hypothetical protein